jgi:hypothetical protein
MEYWINEFIDHEGSKTMAIIKTRKIKLSHSANSLIEKVGQVLNELNGVKEFNYNRNNGNLTIRYDLETVMLKKIEEVLAEQGIQLDSTFFSKIKRGWNHYTEQNELDNLNMHPTCCSDPKATLAKAKHS